jgi:RhoGEF domain
MATRVKPPLFLPQHLNNLLENYLEPLKRETFLSNAEITALFGNIQEIVTFQRQFLQNLEEALGIEPDFHRFEHSGQFRVSRTSTTSIKIVNFPSLPDRTFSLPLGRHFCITLITSSCILHSVPVIVRHRKFYIQVSILQLSMFDKSIEITLQSVIHSR